MAKLVIEALATSIDAYHRCVREAREAPQYPHLATWIVKHAERVAELARKYLPSGSGIDSGCIVDIEASRADRIVIRTSFHHMNDGGYYDGWTDHTVTVRPSFIGRLDITIGGRDRNGIKEYLAETFDHALTREIPD